MRIMRSGSIVKIFSPRLMLTVSSGTNALLFRITLLLVVVIVTLLTSYLDDATKRPGNARIRNLVASVWEISHLDLRLALLEAGMGVTYLSDRVLGETDGLHPITGLEISTMTRDVGLYYKKHKALSEGAKRFIAICQTRFAAGE